MTGVEREQFAQSILADKEYAEALRDAEISTGLAYQIRSLREARGWSQAEFGARAVDETGRGMLQERISELESPDYGRYSLRTLRRIASACDVNLIVRFAPFGGLADWLAELPPERLTIPSRLDDPGLRAQIAESVDLNVDTSTVAVFSQPASTTGDETFSSGVGRVSYRLLEIVSTRTSVPPDTAPTPEPEVMYANG